MTTGQYFIRSYGRLPRGAEYGMVSASQFTTIRKDLAKSFADANRQDSAR
jgi:hypothetical protein